MTSNDPAQIRADIDATRAQVAADVDVLGEKVSPSAVAQRQGDRLKGYVTGAKDAVFGSASDVSDSAGAAAGSAKQVLADAPHQAKQKAEGNAIAVGLVGFGLGLWLASMIPSTRKEQEVATSLKNSDQVADATEQVKSVASELLDHAKESAQSVAAQAKEGVDVVREEGADAAQDVRASAQDSAGTATSSLGSHDNT